MPQLRRHEAVAPRLPELRSLPWSTGCGTQGSGLMRPSDWSKRGLDSGVAARNSRATASDLLAPRSCLTQFAWSLSGPMAGRAPHYLVTKNPLHSKADTSRPAAFPFLAIALLRRRIGSLPCGRLGLIGHTRPSVTGCSVLPSGS